MVSMKVHLLCPFALGVIFILSLNSCTKTVEQTNTVIHDSTVVKHDTTGGAWIRFVSMFPGNTPSGITIFDADSNTIFTVAGNACPGNYYPLPPDTSSVFYATISNLGWKNLPLYVTALGPTLNTCGLFLEITNNNGQLDSSLRSTFSVDSEKLIPPPSGMCYVRFMDGLEDPTGPFYVELDADSVNKSLFHDSQSNPSPIGFSGISPYALIPATQHKIYFHVDDPSNPQAPVFSISPLFEDGHYYDIQATGWVNSGNGPTFSVYEE